MKVFLQTSLLFFKSLERISLVVMVFFLTYWICGGVISFTKTTNNVQFVKIYERPDIPSIINIKTIEKKDIPVLSVLFHDRAYTQIEIGEQYVLLFDNLTKHLMLLEKNNGKEYDAVVIKNESSYYCYPARITADFSNTLSYHTANPKSITDYSVFSKGVTYDYYDDDSDGIWDTLIIQNHDKKTKYKFLAKEMRWVQDH
jgi:hypothetical protein